MNTKVSGVALIIFVRFPRSGVVKTRLAVTIGRQAATEFYRLCAEHILRESGRLSGKVDRLVFYSDGTDRNEMQGWVGLQFQLNAQTGGDLGKRMEHAFHSVFRRGVRKAIILGTDVPDLSAGIIDDTISALDSCDIVIGPCQDGGYYLLGMKELHKELFTDVPWSTDKVLKRTLDTVKALGLTLHQLPTLADIDTEEDLRRWFEANTTDKGHPVRAFVRSLDMSGTVRRFRDGGESP